MGGNNVTESIQRDQRDRCWVREKNKMLLHTIKYSDSSHYKYHPKKWALGYLCCAFMNQQQHREREREGGLSPVSLHSLFQ